MITYNFRHRGPYEYDKFILNIFQFHNEVVMLHGKIFKAAADDKEELLGIKASFDDYYDKCVGDESLSNEVYKQFLLID